MASSDYPRDMLGYGPNSPRVRWPGDARVAVQFVLNYEEGGENAVLHGDAASETFLSEIVGALPYPGARHMSMESLYEYGSRVGVWRVLDAFRERGMPLTIFAVAMALERNPLVAEIALKDGHEIACHGLRWINYHGMAEDLEREHMTRAIEIQTRIAGSRPLGWYTGRTSESTRRLVCEEGGFVYDADDYSDELPFWSRMTARPHLVVPYTLDANDMRFATPQGFNTGGDFFSYLKDSFDTLYAEGETCPRMMSVGLHCRLVGRPGRIAALKRFLDYVGGHDRVWVARRIDIANAFIEQFPWTPKQG
ncbi:allantoinase PuuE [Hansschlegelia quercus]|uniref:Chitooligosaccharide deacetylase n=1 Tax=Hansschlegelia quercus TaxID=2528245 RepID=A0A4Q9GKP8_9HYPH|nr:allantoinase PuuE [Hansschlegelia quercus]TBN54788.1 allantoinase PuuE [Hansschlegelia quercus]